MEVKWEVIDIVEGQRFKRPGSSETHIIGYDTATHGEQNQAFALISLIDGAIWMKNKKAGEVAEFLTLDNYQPIELVNRFSHRDA